MFFRTFRRRKRCVSSARISLFLLLFASFFVLKSEAKIVLSLTRKMENCTWFKNNMIYMDQTREEQLSKKETGTVGTLVLLEDLTEGIDFKIRVERYVKGKYAFIHGEYYNDICKLLKTAGFFWAVFLEAVNINGCPVKKGELKLKEPLMELDVKRFAVNPWIKAAYRVTIEVFRERKTILCLVIHLGLSTKQN